jgi:predicted kinase
MSGGTSPLLVIVSGPPASGKTTIAERLAGALNLPLLTKDSFKELLADTLHVDGIDWSKKLGAASFELLFSLAERLLVANVSVVIEGNFEPDLSIDRFKAITCHSGASVAQVICRADPEELVERYKRRDASGQRHAIHADGRYVSEETFVEQFRDGLDEPLNLPGPVFDIDTTDGETVDIGEIASAIERRLAGKTSGERG